MEWVSVLVEEPDFGGAVDAAAEGVQEGLEGPPDVIFAFPSAGYGDAPWDLIDKLERSFPGTPIVGCVGGGIIGDGREVEGIRGLSLTAARLPGVEVQPISLDNNMLPAPDAPAEAWRALFGLPEGAVPHFVITSDPATFDVERLIQGIDLAWPQGTCIGGVASGARRPGGHLLFAGDEVLQGGAAGVVLTGDLTVDTVVAQGCRPIGAPMFVTRGEGRLIAELDGRPATQVIAELFEGLPPEEKGLFRTSLFIGLVMEPSQQLYRQGDFLIRNIMGVDPHEGTLAVGARVSAQQVVQFHLRDARTSEEDLRALLKGERAAQEGTPPAGALMFSCLGRGEGLYGQPDVESRVLQGTFGAIPAGGFFCNGEIGPVHGRTFLHGYTSALGLFRPRNCQ